MFKINHRHASVKQIFTRIIISTLEILLDKMISDIKMMIPVNVSLFHWGMMMIEVQLQEKAPLEQHKFSKSLPMVNIQCITEAYALKFGNGAQINIFVI